VTRSAFPERQPEAPHVGASGSLVQLSSPACTCFHSSMACPNQGEARYAERSLRSPSGDRAPAAGLYAQPGGPCQPGDGAARPGRSDQRGDVAVRRGGGRTQPGCPGKGDPLLGRRRIELARLTAVRHAAQIAQAAEPTAASANTAMKIMSARYPADLIRRPQPPEYDLRKLTPQQISDREQEIAKAIFNGGRSATPTSPNPTWPPTSSPWIQRPAPGLHYPVRHVRAQSRGDEIHHWHQ
jgi:hypothetical protein